MNDFKIKDGIYIRVISKEDNIFIKDNVTTYNQYRKLKDKVGLKDIKCIIEDKIGITLFNIMAYGETDDISVRILSKIIDNVKIASQSVNETNITTAHYCFRTVDKNVENRHGIPHYSYDNMVIHHDKLGSWKCLLEQLQKPDYALIYKLKEDKDGKES